MNRPSRVHYAKLILASGFPSCTLSTLPLLPETQHLAMGDSFADRLPGRSSCLQRACAIQRRKSQRLADRVAQVLAKSILQCFQVIGVCQLFHVFAFNLPIMHALVCKQSVWLCLARCLITLPWVRNSSPAHGLKRCFLWGNWALACCCQVK